MTEKETGKTPAPEVNEDACRCPICAAPFKPGDICATDITEGPCHAACLEGSPVVDLETGEETGGKVDTYRYSDVMEPAPKTKMTGIADEQVEAALCAWFKHEVTWGAGLNSFAVDWFRNQMRASLVAALATNDQMTAASDNELAALAKHFMEALLEICVEDDIVKARGLASTALTTRPGHHMVTNDE